MMDYVSKFMCGWRSWIKTDALRVQSCTALHIASLCWIGLAYATLLAFGRSWIERGIPGSIQCYLIAKPRIERPVEG